MCVETLRTGLCFSEMIELRGHMPRFTLKMNILPPMSLENTINVRSDPQNSVSFSKMIDLRGHMPRFPQKMTHVFTCL